MAGPKYRSLAVLPLANLTGDPEQQYFVDGITDTLINGVAQIYAALGEKDKALDLLETCYRDRTSTLPWIRVHGGEYESLFDEPRFQALVKKMNLPSLTRGRRVPCSASMEGGCRHTNSACSVCRDRRKVHARRMLDSISTRSIIFMLR